MSATGQGDGPDAGPVAARPALPVRLGRYANRWTQPERDWIARQVNAGRLRAWRHRDTDDGRDLMHQRVWSACYAPLTSMYLDQFGKVRACCQNTEQLLGDVTEQSLREIWDGADTAILRKALAAGDFDRGCQFCSWEQAEAGPASSFARWYDGLVADGRQPRWPKQLEFAVTNTCNLQCVMCNGDWSSSIRSQREHLPPLRSSYQESFFEELREFIPHLESAKFTGGEPFLGREPLRILSLLDELGAPDLKITVTTNGTIWNDRIADLITRMHITPVISIDGGTRETYEAIRVGASFDEVTGNLRRLLAITRPRERNVSIAHCLMVDNWHTFPEMLQLAEEHQLFIGINTVRFPAEHSLYQLTSPELDEVVRELEARTPEVERTVTGQRLDQWHRQLQALRARGRSSDWPEALGVAPGPPAASVAVPVMLPTRKAR